MPDTIEIPAFIARHADGGLVLDVREPGEYEGGHVPGAILAPLDRVASALARIPRKRPVHVICQSGNRSRTATEVLARLGYDAVSVAGGTAAWVAAGQPVVVGPRAR